ncbi:relaxase [Pseudoclavibacter sp. RFBJ3]|uniref:relaxase/mobilization nuclease domain-containing protein n=1 Tax=unclassified Pseudoclavibacter TaxID=2615177 RepID=UPI000CE73C83|nr:MULTISPECIES: relaxase/mobilization nuclease domain-containing protein [unclassified Pseudoclavibacter]PPF83303.1 relaxase [Pseudoclavibacter sp. RFBJ5]PPF91845.1 relaxase [Pseudoclavibacter sp. RFBJ3]PPG01107.1 relaxase [Pseudoclavibacter sp. RFBH5]PPG26210.1 relaxase [Pseudoclavibacter sp. RFBI4]
MMPNVTRGDRMAGLMTYLVGKGRANEHTEPHLVAGDAALMAWHDDAELGDDAARSIARHLDRPRTSFGVDVPGGHVWHASLSLRAEEGLRTDEEWGAIAQDFVTAMGFDDNEGTKAPCRWVAVRHGVSKAGNDHIHIAVNLVRDDGTKASIHNDFHRAQTVARALEVKYGLEQLESTKGERSTRGYSPAEQARVEERAAMFAQKKYEQQAERSAEPMPSWAELDGKERQVRVAAEVRLNVPRNDLARTVRGAAAASDSEGEFVRRMRRSGVLVRPRFADGRTDVITGYSVAARPKAGERPIWYGGGHLGRDLTLPRLREGWPDTPTGATEAAAEWNAAKRGQRVAAPGRESTEPDPELWSRYAKEVGELNEQLRAVPMEDRETWQRVARDTAGAFAAWSKAVEAEPGDLAAAADALSKSAQTHRRPERAPRSGMASIGGAAMLLASAARGGQGKAAELAMLRQLMNLAGAVYDATRAAGELRQAQLMEADVRDRLMRVRQGLAPAPAATAGTASTSTATISATRASIDETVAEELAKMDRAAEHRKSKTSSPVPDPIEPTKARTTARPVADRGPER